MRKINNTKNQRFLACPSRHSHLNKRGFFLASQVVKIVIAVICIGFLIYFLTVLYFSKVAERKGREATNALIESDQSIRVKIEQARQGKGSQEFTFPNPEAWYLFSFVGAEKKPNSCAGENCLCICENVWDYFDRQIKYCDDTGACLIVSDLEEKDLEIEIEVGKPTILIQYVNNKISIT